MKELHSIEVLWITDQMTWDDITMKPKSPVPLHCSALWTVYFIFLSKSESYLYFLCFRLQSNRYNAERYFKGGRLCRCRGGVHVRNDCSSEWVACYRQPQGRFCSVRMWCHLVWWIHNNFFSEKCRELFSIELWNLYNVMSHTAIHKTLFTVRAHTTCSTRKCNSM